MKKIFKWAGALLLLLGLFFGSGLADEIAPSPQGRAAAPGGQLTITLLDVGHGDAILLQQGGKNAMIDVGDRSAWQILQDRLAERQVQRVEKVFITHHHSDHMGNILNFLPRYKVSRVYDNGGVNEKIKKKTSVKLRQILDRGDYGYAKGGRLEAGSRVELGPGYYLEIFSPGSFLTGSLSKKELKNINNTGLVMKLHYGDFTMLFTGDAEAPAEAALAQRLSLEELYCDVLKVGHHGSRNSSYYPFIAKVKPRYALISCGDFQKYHHPNPKTVGRLQHIGATVYNTREHGCLTVVTDGKNYQVRKER